MKKIVIILTFVFALLFTGCSESSSANTPSVADVQEQTGDSELRADVSDSIMPDPDTETTSDTQPDTPTSETAAKTVFELFEDELSKENVSYEKVWLAGEMVGATEAYRYKIGEGCVELYLFDPESDKYKSVEESQTVSLDEQWQFTVKAVNGAALYVSDLDKDYYEGLFDNIQS